MNCFNARKEFRSFWCKILPPGQRQEFIEHLKDCAPCDRAFRLFALSAPVLHSDARAITGLLKDDGAGPLDLPAAREIAPTLRPERRPWAVLCVGLSMVALAGFAAYLAAARPGQSLNDALTSSQPVGEIFSGQELPPALDDLAG